MSEDIGDDQYVYKAGKNSIITLEITGKTNENREGVVDPLHAKFRTNKAYVVDIENFETKEKMKEDRSIYDITFVYKVGHEMKPDYFNNDINETCTFGIHYFKTRETAESWQYFCNDKFEGEDGLYRQWYEDGQLESESNYKNGIGNGLCRLWHQNGQLCIESNYKNGHLNGQYRKWYDNGKLSVDQNYRDGNLDCSHNFYYMKNGEKCK